MLCAECWEGMKDKNISSAFFSVFLCYNGNLLLQVALKMSLLVSALIMTYFTNDLQTVTYY